MDPDFNSPTVLTRDPWEYVSLWMRRAKAGDASFFWGQAHQFYDATVQLPPASAPLTAYYCILNATKALLKAKGIAHTPFHGLTGNRKPGKTALSNEEVLLKGGGVHAALRQYFGEQVQVARHNLQDILYNLAFVHRAFQLTYTNRPELFIPIQFPRFVRKEGSSEAWFCANIQGGHYQSQHWVNKLPQGYELDKGAPEPWVIRRRKRFSWKDGKPAEAGNVLRLKSYHAEVREHVSYIHGSTRLWYLKRSPISGTIPLRNMTLIYAAMHRLSELARYTPDLLEKHFACQHNWLLTQFITLSLDQFVDEVACEITGKDFMTVGLRA
ncbi:YaaC family protein [Alienimonas sp. DA493]|uniref:YaaC family protein n=1 Tax=Alienimonas sp. DA493 TaxID=3373605 RepID=UPI00375441A2